MNLLFQNYLTRGFWGDEAWTALISALPISEMLRVTGEDFHPPFYYFLVHNWGSLFGFGEISIRLISLIFFLLTPIVVYFLSQIFFKDTKKSLLTSFLVLISPILFTYAFEARAYALLAFLSVSSALAFWRSRTETSYTWRIIYFILGAVSVYTHYYAWFILTSHGILFERKTIKRLLVPAIAILVVQLPWLPTLFSQIGQVNTSYWIAPINSTTHLEFFLRIASGDHTTPYQIPIAIIISLAVLLNLLPKITKTKPGLIQTIVKIIKRFLKLIPDLSPSLSRRPFTSEGFSRQEKFLFTWLIIPTLIPTIISFKIPIFFYRYLIFSSIPLLMLTVDGLTRLKKPLQQVGFVTVFLLYLLIIYNGFSRFPHTMREELTQVYQTKTPGDGPIYTVLPSFAETMYYVGDRDQIKVLPEGIVQFSGKSLLDSFVRSDVVEITKPPAKSSYWLLQPGPKSQFVADGLNF